MGDNYLKSRVFFLQESADGRKSDHFGDIFFVVSFDECKIKTSSKRGFNSYRKEGREGREKKVKSIIQVALETAKTNRYLQSCTVFVVEKRYHTMY